MRVVLTGGAGYLGSVLARLLVDAGHDLLVIDKLLFGSNLPPGIPILPIDIVDVDAGCIAGFDAAIHLAACSNDPMSEMTPELAWRTNVAGTRRVVEACLEGGVRRFVHASTCSLYGRQPGAILDEQAAVNPVGAYGETKRAAESVVREARKSGLETFILRKGTLHGLSPRMRTDLVVNAMVKAALMEHVIRVSDGRAYRPLLHVQDAARAYLCALEAPASHVGTYNVHEANYRIADVALLVAEEVRAAGRTVRIDLLGRSEIRDYCVTSDRFYQEMNFRPVMDVRGSVREMLHATPAGLDWRSPLHVNAEVYGRRFRALTAR